jgi:hypothetical protein
MIANSMASGGTSTDFLVKETGGQIKTKSVTITSGSSGSSGTSGGAGAAGSSGSSGSSGTSGSSGYSGVNGSAGSSGSSGSSGTSGVAAERAFTWVIANPSPGYVLGPHLIAGFTPSSVDHFVSANTNVVFQIMYGTTPGTWAGTAASAGTATTAAGTSTAVPSAIAAGNWIVLSIASTSGTTGQLTVTLGGA